MPFPTFMEADKKQCDEAASNIKFIFEHNIGIKEISDVKYDKPQKKAFPEIKDKLKNLDPTKPININFNKERPGGSIYKVTYQSLNSDTVHEVELNEKEIGTLDAIGQAVKNNYSKIEAAKLEDKWRSEEVKRRSAAKNELLKNINKITEDSIDKAQLSFHDKCDILSKNPPQIRSLEINLERGGNRNIILLSLAEVLKNNKSITSLSLIADAKELSMIRRGTYSAETDPKIAHEFSEALKANTTLKSLKISIGLQDDSLIEIFAGLKENKSIQKVDFSYNQLTDEGAKAFAETIAGGPLPTIDEKSGKERAATSAAATATAAASASTAAAAPSTLPSVTKANDLGNIPQTKHKIEEFDVSTNNIGTKGNNALLSAISVNHNILSCSGVGPEVEVVRLLQINTDIAAERIMAEEIKSQQKRKAEVQAGYNPNNIEDVDNPTYLPPDLVNLIMDYDNKISEAPKKTTPTNPPSSFTPGLDAAKDKEKTKKDEQETANKDKTKDKRPPMGG